MAADEALTSRPSAETLRDVEFAEFFARERKPLIRYLMSLRADEDLAGDIAQTAFEKAFAQWGTIDHPAAWLRQTALNEFRMHCRGSAREISVDSVPERRISAFMAVESHAETRETLRLLETLPLKQREVMALHYDGFSDAEIAGEIGDTPEAVRKNRNRAMKSLRRSLQSTRRAAR